MHELKLERTLSCDIDTAFRYITEPAKLLTWWGPEGMTIHDEQLDFSRVGPWVSEMRNKEGNAYRVSGEVTDVDPPNSVTLSWAWHEEDGTRGHESQVRFDLRPVTEGTQFTLVHSGLASEESATAHTEGWTSSIGRLVRQF